MGTLNLQINAIAYKDNKPSNNPLMRAFDYTIKLLGNAVNLPKSNDYTIAPGEVRNIFNGTRTTAIDGTTAFDVSQPDPSVNVYRFTNSGGTAPVLRTDRVPAVDNTSQFSVTVNGPLMTITNTGGTALDTTNVVVGDQLLLGLGSGFNPANCGQFTIIAKSSNSLTVQNLNAAAETVTVADFTQFFVYSNGGGNSNQIQIGDKAIIAAGFSQVTWGTYDVTQVTPTYFEIAVAAPNGLPLETGIMPGTSGLIFYSAAKRFVMVQAQQKCSIRCNSDVSDNNVVEPVEADNPERPGVFLKQGTVYSLSINNLSLEPLQVTVSSAE